MQWININVTTLDSEAFIGSDPVQRATWLCLLRYCTGQENGGRILDAAEWSDRKWQQIVRVTRKEVRSTSVLWSWDGNHLVLAFYPLDRENEVRANRLNGTKGGRPRKPIQEPVTEPKENHPVSENKTDGLEIVKTERKGKGREGKENAFAQACANECLVTDPDSSSSPHQPQRKPEFEIPTKDQAVRYSMDQPGWSIPVTVEWWLKRDSVGWIDGRGLTIANWRSDLTAWQHRHARGEAPGQGVRPWQEARKRPLNERGHV